MQHTMNLHNEPFNKIKGGTKTVEMRLFDERRKGINIGDTILFTNNTTGEKLAVQVTNMQAFANFEELYENYDKVSIGYAPDEAANPTDMNLYYTNEQIATYGVVAIGIKLC